MSRWRPEPVSLGLSSRELALAWRERGSGQLQWRAGPAPGASAPASAWIEAATQLAQQCGLRPGRLRVSLAPDLVHWWSVTPAAGTRSLAELRQYAALRFEESFGLDPAQWHLAGDWRSDAPTVCHAMPQAVALALGSWRDGPAWARRASWRALEAMPAALRACPARVALGVVILDDVATLVWRQRSRLARVRSLRVEPRDPWPAIGEELGRVQAAAGLPAGEGAWVGDARIAVEPPAALGLARAPSPWAMLHQDVPPPSAAMLAACAGASA